MSIKQRRRHFIDQLEDRLLLTSETLPLVAFQASEPLTLLPASQGQIVSGALVDLNRDGLPDYVVATRNPSRVYFLLAQEGGDLRQAVTESTTVGARVETADLNGDGWIDVLVISENQVQSFINLANSELGWRGVDSQEAIGTGGAAVIGDIDGDTLPDLVLGTTQGVEVRLGIGEGHFAAPVNYLAGQGERQVALGDLDADGDLDLAVGLREKSQVMLLQNDGQGVFEVAGTIADAGTARTILLEDLDADEFADLIVGTHEQEGHNIHVWKGDGLGGVASDSVDYETVGSPMAFAIADVNTDGRRDLVVGHDSTFHHPITNNGPGGVSVLLASGTGSLQPSVRIATPGAMDVFIEPDTDSSADQIVAFQQHGNTVTKWSWGDQAMFDLVTDVSPAASDRLVFRVSVVGDFNGDGHEDVAMVSRWRESGHLDVFFGDGEAGYQEFKLLFTQQTLVSNLFTGDFNGDGLTDVGVEIENRAAGVFLSHDNRTFSEFVPTRFSGTFIDPQVADLNGDGVDDLVGREASFQATQLRVALGQGDGTWQRPQQFELRGRFFREIRLLDVNADGQLDALALSGESIDVALGNGDGTFRPVESTRLESHFSAVADFDGDGLPDVVSSRFGDPSIQVWLSTSAGRFSLNPVTIPVEISDVESIHAVDVNHDGVSEILVGNRVGFSLFRSSDQGFLGDPFVAVGFGPGRVVTQDVTGDGILDLVIGQGMNFISSSPATKIAIARGRADGQLEMPIVLTTPIVDGTIWSVQRNETRQQIMLLHAFGFSVMTGDVPLTGDFDGNGRLSAADIDLLCAAAHNPNLTPADIRLFDLINEGQDAVVDALDVDYWLAELAGTARGDVNLDGYVNFDDFVQLANHFGQRGASWHHGDVDCDGQIDFDDFVTLQSNFGFGTGG